MNPIITLFSVLLLAIAVVAQNQDYVYMSTCPESDGRSCGYTNYTQYMLALKKNGGDIASTNSYQSYFFPCEEYTFDCGYMEKESDDITIANGIELNMTQTQLNSLNIVDTTLKDKIKPYLGLSGSSTACATKVFPLTLTPVQSQDFFTAYMSNLTTYISTLYAAQKDASSKAWADLNINIKTATLQAIKAGVVQISSTANSYWMQFLSNNFTGMSSTLKQYYTQTNVQTALHCAYLIDKVTQQCNKYQSVNFLVDESGSIGTSAFTLCLDFLKKYVTVSLDDTSIMSINFFDGAYESYLGYGHDKAYLLSQIPIKNYRQGTTKTGIAINASVQLIKNQTFDNGVPKILVVMTDGGSSDDVLRASNYARQNDITMISVGIGGGVNKAQLLQIAGTSDNMLTISSYADLDKLVQFIANYFCKQIKTINLGDNIVGNRVRVPTSPNYYRIVKSPYQQWYQLTVTYQLPTSQTNQSAYQSQIDPFPNAYTQYDIPQAFVMSETKKIYFIRPQNNISLIKKVNLTQLTTVDTSYLAFRGNDLKFNLSLKACETTNCSMQRYNATIQSNSCGADCVDPLPTTDPTFFGVVSGVLVGLALCTLLGILGLRRLLGEQQQQEMIRNLPQVTQENDQLSVSSQNKSSKKSKSKKSSKSSSKNSESS